MKDGDDPRIHMKPMAQLRHFVSFVDRSLARDLLNTKKIGERWPAYLNSHVTR
jgi:hypothetical protein